MANKTSQHILTTSTNLLGFCLIVFTSLHMTDKTTNSIIDEITAIVAIMLAISSLLSFLSIRTDREMWEKRLEFMADVLFFMALTGITIILAILVFNVV